MVYATIVNETSTSGYYKIQACDDETKCNKGMTYVRVKNPLALNPDVPVEFTKQMLMSPDNQWLYIPAGNIYNMKNADHIRKFTKAGYYVLEHWDQFKKQLPLPSVDAILMKVPGDYCVPIQTCDPLYGPEICCSPQLPPKPPGGGGTGDKKHLAAVSKRTKKILLAVGLLVLLMAIISVIFAIVQISRKPPGV